MLRTHRRRHRPKAKEENNHPKHHGERIHRNAKNARKPKRAPNQLIGFVASIVVVVCVDFRRGVADGACAAAPEKEGFSDDVGGVEGADAEGDDVVEGGGGADVDEADEAGDEGGDEDGEEGDRGVGLDLRGFV